MSNKQPDPNYEKEIYNIFLRPESKKVSNNLVMSGELDEGQTLETTLYSDFIYDNSSNVDYKAKVILTTFRPDLDVHDLGDVHIISYENTFNFYICSPFGMKNSINQINQYMKWWTNLSEENDFSKEEKKLLDGTFHSWEIKEIIKV